MNINDNQDKYINETQLIIKINIRMIITDNQDIYTNET